MGTLTDPETYRLDPAMAGRRLKIRSNNRKMLALAWELATWRETTAQKRDLPRSRILRDESLLEIAAHAPRNVDDLARSRGLGKGFAEGKFGTEILAVVAQVLAMPESSYPAPTPRRDPPQGIGPLVDLFRVLLKMRAEESDVASRLIADAEDLEMLAADDSAKVRALAGWRFEIFGRDALDLKHGRLALTAAGKRIKLVRTDTTAPQAAQ
jgi:ribonuclease D